MYIVRICTYTRILTYFLYPKLLGASILSYTYNIREYVQYTYNILNHIRSYTSKYIQYTWIFLGTRTKSPYFTLHVYGRICSILMYKTEIYELGKYIRTEQVYACICMYMHVSACILLLPPLTIGPIACKFVYVCICTYMMAFVCIWGICTYCACICMYFLESHLKTRETMPRPQSTVSRGGNRRAILSTSLGIWASTFFRTGQMLLGPDLAHPTPRHASRAPEASLPLAAGRSPMHDPRTAIQSRDLSHQIWLVEAHADAGHRPSKTQPDCNSPMSVYVCICM